MITKEIVTGMVSILEGGTIQVREDTVIIEDGIELSRTFHREVLEPGDNLSGKDERIKKIASVIWTNEVIEKRQIELAQIRLKMLSALNNESGNNESGNKE